jgi:hypothetical protein
MAMTYNDAREQFIQNYGSPINWLRIFDPGSKPLHAFSVFDTKEAAQAYVEGEQDEEDESIIYYTVYPGQLICVTNDPTDGNNGLYEVILNPEYSENDPEVSTNVRKFTLNKYYDANTIENIISGIQPGSGDIHFKNADTLEDSQTKGHLVYFTGISDVSNGIRECDSSTLLFTQFIGYDTLGTLFSNGIANTSDIRLKDHIEDLDVDLGKIGEIDKIRFTWKDNMNGKRQIGTTAQSLEATFPDLVYTNPDTGYKAVNYDGLSVIALAAIDKLYARVRDLENEVRKLKAGNTEQ